MSNAPEKVSVAIIGGGMGGITAVVALQSMGIDAHLYEQAPAFGEVGGHLTIDTAAIEVLDRFGLGAPFLEIGQKLDGIEVRGMDSGDVLARFQMPDLGSMGVEDPNRHGRRDIFAFLRADFVSMAVARAKEGTLHNGCRLTALRNEEEGAVAEFDNGTVVHADIIIGADGVKSMARQMFDDFEPVSAGINICRANVSVDSLPEGMPADRMRFYDGWAFGDMEKNYATHVLFVPVRGGSLLSVDFNLHGGDLLEDCDPWDLPVDRILARLPENADPLITALAEARVEPFAGHTLFDRPVAKKWHEGNIAILGDAAHAMRPTLGQGACQAIHDAGALATAMQEHGVTTAALAAYEGVRKDYVQSIVDVAKNTRVNPKEWEDRG